MTHTLPRFLPHRTSRTATPGKSNWFIRGNRPAFTLIELLVVIAIIAIVAGIIFPVFARAREAGRRTVCLANLHQIGLAMNMYLADHDDIFPGLLSDGDGGQLDPNAGNAVRLRRWTCSDERRQVHAARLSTPRTAPRVGSSTSRRSGPLAR